MTVNHFKQILKYGEHQDIVATPLYNSHAVTDYLKSKKRIEIRIVSWSKYSDTYRIVSVSMQLYDTHYFYFRPNQNPQMDIKVCIEMAAMCKLRFNLKPLTHAIFKGILSFSNISLSERGKYFWVQR